MRFFSKLFGEKEELVEEEVVEVVKLTGHTCDICKMSIQEGQKIKTFDNKKYHLKPCWRNLIKEQKKAAYR